jgi:hypothetical protein
MEMRRCQRRYFKTRKPEDLIASKVHEKHFDDALRIVLAKVSL